MDLWKPTEENVAMYPLVVIHWCGEKRFITTMDLWKPTEENVAMLTAMGYSKQTPRVPRPTLPPGLPRRGKFAQRGQNTRPRQIGRRERGEACAE